ncbi:hypothetical protein NP233_g10704 [Leucocoprinus birnbaumii]|uniref:Uncharacterized protein n=1 Tax=Leucocoprinus birnbaumii TaxID=56174 RepID=A0AAD5YPK5_9AGAR|nr:hypothetical protein NP233_g10704 [Leucocoprinus birnbaumii]
MEVVDGFTERTTTRAEMMYILGWDDPLRWTTHLIHTRKTLVIEFANAASQWRSANLLRAMTHREYRGNALLLNMDALSLCSSSEALQLDTLPPSRPASSAPVLAALLTFWSRAKEHLGRSGLSTFKHSIPTFTRLGSLSVAGMSGRFGVRDSGMRVYLRVYSLFSSARRSCYRVHLLARD